MDLNADMAEGSGPEGWAADASLLNVITSANIACGGHAGDAETMRRACDAAIERGVRIGAHPGYGDRENFGRTELGLATGEVVAQVAEQITLLESIAASSGSAVTHVKLHGALYHRALRDDELAAACMGLDPARLKLQAFAGGAALAGIAGCLYATNLTTTADPNNYDFNNAIMVLCCLILGGLGTLRGALLGAALVIGFDNVLSPLLDRALQQLPGVGGHPLANFSAWRWMLFGLLLVVMMRVRPAGLFAPATARAAAGEAAR